MDLTDARLRQRILVRGARSLVEEAGRASALYVNGGERVWAIGMINAINKGLRYKFKMRGYDDSGE